MNEWPKLRHRFSIARNGHPFPTGDAVNDMTAMVAQLADRHLRHVYQCITRETTHRVLDGRLLDKSGTQKALNHPDRSRTEQARLGPPVTLTTSR